MAKIAIQSKQLELGLGIVDRIEINVNYSIGDESTTLQVKYFNGNVEVTTLSPKLIPVSPQTMQAWGYDFTPVRDLVLAEIGAEIDRSQETEN